jgi:molecular chaperone DnaK
MVGRMLEKISGKEPKLAGSPEHIVAHGAAIHAAILQMNRPRRTAVAVDGSLRKAGDDGWSGTSADDEAIEFFSESVLSAGRSVSVQNVNAHSLGVVVRASRERRIVNSQIIQRNTPLPTTRTKVFGTEVPNQSMVRLRIVEGESRDPMSCTQIGECIIRDLPPGLPQASPVEVSFRFDSSGRLHVKAVELTHKATAEVELQRDSGFLPSEISNMAESVSQLLEEKA